MKKFETPLASSSYVYGLDIIRFLCALMVAVFHLTWRRTETAYAMPLGWVGVQIFFVISGVVIANSAAMTVPVQFLRGRFLRLYPAAWIAALVNGGILLMVPRPDYQALGINVIPQVGAFARSLTLFADYALASAYWTLPIELAFYGVVVAALWLGGRNRFRLIARTLIAISIVYASLLFMEILHVLNVPWLDLGYGLKNALLVRHGSYFAIGMYLWMFSNKRTLGPTDAVFFVIALVACVLEIACRASELGGIFAPGGRERLSGTALALGGNILFFGFLGLIFWSLQCADKWIPAGNAKSWLRTIGLMTYPFYLIHEVTGGAVLHFAIKGGLEGPASLAIALFVVAVLAHAIASRIEPAVRRLTGRPVDHALGLLPNAKDIDRHMVR